MDSAQERTEPCFFHNSKCDRGALTVSKLSLLRRALHIPVETRTSHTVITYREVLQQTHVATGLYMPRQERCGQHQWQLIEGCESDRMIGEGSQVVKGLPFRRNDGHGGDLQRPGAQMAPLMRGHRQEHSRAQSSAECWKQGPALQTRIGCTFSFVN